MNNAKTLSAVISHWIQPFVATMASGAASAIPIIQLIENKIRSTGWVSGSWSLLGELSPIMDGIVESLIAPVLSQYLSQVDDTAIPGMAHKIVDKALEVGELTLFEGKVIIEKEDLEDLKRLLNANLPYKESDEFKIITDV